MSGLFLGTSNLPPGVTQGMIDRHFGGPFDRYEEPPPKECRDCGAPVEDDEEDYCNECLEYYNDDGDHD